MGGGTPRKSYTKIKNFTEKDQVRIKYSHIGKDKKLMLSVYIGEDVYNELTNGQTFKRLKVEYIPNDMVIITPTNEEKEGIIHRYNGKGLFKTTCVRLSLSGYKKLKIRKKDFNNRVVSYSIVSGIYAMNNRHLNVDLIGSKKSKLFVNKVEITDIVPQDYVSNSKIKPLEISAPDFNDMPSREYIDGPTPMFVSHDFLNDVRDTIENRLLGIEERFEKRMREIESLLEEFMDQPLPPLKPSEENSLDIDILKKISNNITDVMNFKLSKIESEINELINVMNFKLSKIESEIIKNAELNNRLNKIKKSHEDKSIFEKIFGKD